MESRSEARGSFTADTRLRLLETDVDTLERAIQKVNDRLGKILWVCVSLLMSVATSMILLALNLVVVR